MNVAAAAGATACGTGWAQGAPPLGDTPGIGDPLLSLPRSAGSVAPLAAREIEGKPAVGSFASRPQAFALIAPAGAEANTSGTTGLETTGIGSASIASFTGGLCAVSASHGEPASDCTGTSKTWPTFVSGGTATTKN